MKPKYKPVKVKRWWPYVYVPKDSEAFVKPKGEFYLAKKSGKRKEKKRRRNPKQRKNIFRAPAG